MIPIGINSNNMTEKLEKYRFKMYLSIMVKPKNPPNEDFAAVFLFFIELSI
jgi:hypothetical protein